MIEKRRQPFPNLEALYFLTPHQDSVALFLEDFSFGKAMYGGAHLFFTETLHDGLFKMITASQAAPYIKNFQELFVNFSAFESRVFLVDRPNAFYSLYGFEQRDFQTELTAIGKHMISVCATLNENPIIRYYRPTGQPDSLNRTAVSSRVAQAIQMELDNYCKINPEFPTAADPPRPRAVLYVVDRSMDMFAPLLHEFTYQAMANDLLTIDGGKRYIQEFTAASGDVETKESVLDESDAIWAESRHGHIAETSEKLAMDFTKLVNSNKALALKGKEANLNDMKDILADLPEFQEKKAKYSLHISIAQDCMNLFEELQLSSVGLVEQDMACFDSADHQGTKHVLEDLLPLLQPSDAGINLDDRLRLFMLYLLHKGGLKPDDRKKLFEHCGWDKEEAEAIKNMEQLGVRLHKDKNRPRDKSLKAQYARRYMRRVEDGETDIELSRYVPQLKKMLEVHLRGKVENDAFAYTKEVSAEEKEQQVKETTRSLRSTKAGWTKAASGRGPTSSKGAVQYGRIIVFVAGGVTYSEIRSVYQVAAEHGRDILIGSTNIVTPRQLLHDLRELRNGPPPARPATPPLAAAQPRAYAQPTAPGHGHSQSKDWKSAMFEGDWKSVGSVINKKIDKYSEKVDKWV